MELSGFCSNMSEMLRFFGYAITIFKIAIPLIIVILGMVDLGKAVTASKDDEIKKAFKQLGIRLAAGVVIFFVPTIVVYVFGLVGGFTEISGTGANSNGAAVDFEVCEACLLHPFKSNSACTNAQNY